MMKAAYEFAVRFLHSDLPWSMKFVPFHRIASVWWVTRSISLQSPVTPLESHRSHQCKISVNENQMTVHCSKS